MNNNIQKQFKDILFKKCMYKNTGMDNEVNNDFKKIIYTRRQKNNNRKNINNYKNKLFSSNFRPYIMMANGIQTTVAKGSNSEWMFWSVKDSTSNQGNNYYFDSPKDAERMFDIEYPSYLKQKWHERVTQIINNNENNNENIINE